MEHSEAITETHAPIPVPLRREKPLLGFLWSGFWVFCSVIFPLVVLVVEWMFGLCGQMFFDPIPTLGHALLIALVPAVNLLALLGHRRRRSSRMMEIGLGAALAVTAVYTILFIPVLPFAAMYTAMTFWVFFVPAVLTALPFGPLASLLGTVRNARALARRNGPPARRAFAVGAMAGMLCILALEFPRYAARVTLDSLTQNPLDASALGFARRYADRDTLLLAAYKSSTPPVDFTGWLKDTFRNGSFFEIENSFTRRRTKTMDARRIYYQVTGRNFNELPSPERPLWSIMDSPDVGQLHVGGQAEKLFLTTSTVDASISADALTSYTEWTMTFRNESEQADEARAELVLPRGGIVSRATLWIGDEPVEALFGSRTQTTTAYQNIVSARRDPLLVTTSGPDRVLIQCFPVPAGGTMKIRIGVTAPLELENQQSAAYRLPRIIDQNFVSEDALQHDVWIDSEAPMQSTSTALVPEHIEGVHTLHGAIMTDGPGVRVAVGILRGAQDVHSLDNMFGSGQVVRAEIIEQSYPPADAAVLVIDGSRSMQDSVPGVVSAIKAIPDGLPIAVIIAGDSPIVLGHGQPLQPATPDLLSRISDHIRAFNFEGGRNNLDALTEAWDLAARAPNTRIVWIHSGSPVPMPGMERLEQRRVRRPNGPGFHSIEVNLTPDRPLEQVDRLGMLEPTHRAPGETLAEHTSLLLSGGRRLSLRYSARTAEAEDVNLAAFEHVNRLWAAREVEQMVRFGRRRGNGQEYPKEAAALAVKYRIVTQASGAVVLDGPDRAANSELQPQQAAQVPVIPEPEMYLLFALLFASLAIEAKRNGRLYARRGN